MGQGKPSFYDAELDMHFEGSLDDKVDFEDQKDPNGLDAHSPGAKLDAGKPDLTLLQQLDKALCAVAEVMEYGARKYTRGGWQEVPDGIRRYTAAELRHIFKEEIESHDPETDLLHAAHGACNALFRLELILRKQENPQRETI